MSFTTVAALARDNGFQLIVVIAGTSIPLLEQSTRRLQADLRLLSRPDRKWQHFESQTLAAGDRSTIRDTLADWRDETLPAGQRKTVLITTMKHHGHLDKVLDVLRGTDLKAVPTLVIDDEADQASLNTQVRRKEQSTTYRRLIALRSCLPSHTFLQYTATPQAPLLINIIDNLSPQFAEILTPGSDYVGGVDFFYENSPYVEVIPDSEISSPNQKLTEPPDSLLYAMRVFFLGVAAGYVREEGHGNRSMLVHPSQQVVGHSSYYEWVTQVRDLWKRILDPASGAGAARQELLDQFATAHDDLRRTVPDLPAFAELEAGLAYAIRSTRVELVNAATGATPLINWATTYSHILVGGQAMDRGFTVEGLTVTYMPRSLGVGNADTVQQRARFFGYKRPYLGYCRVFVSNSARDAYAHYVTHEQHIRASLADHQKSGRPLSDWKRVFFLNAMARPTRQTVLDLDYMRTAFGSDWFDVAAPHEPPEALEDNRQAVKSFLDRIRLAPDDGSPDRTEIQRHEWASDVPLRFVLEELLTKLKLGRLEDSQRFTALRILIEEHLTRHTETQCAVYNMSSGKRRVRGLTEDGEIKNLFQGAAPVSPPHLRGTVYPGDRNVGPEDVVKIQVHHLDLEGEDKGIVASNVPTLAVWIPRSMGRDVIVQHQPDQASRER
jgi:hypothetical protein